LNPAFAPNTATPTHVFCGWTPSSVSEQHYLDYSPERLKETSDKAGIMVLK
jgi:hypothetical protein